jgi:hypothetical protein
MEDFSVAILQRLVAIFCAFTLFFAAATAQAEQRPTMTAHVPEAVSSGRAPWLVTFPARSV